MTGTFLGLVDRALNLFLFLGVLMYLVGSEDDMVDCAFKLIPVLPEKQDEISERIKCNISQIFIVSLLLCCLRGTITWFYFTAMNLVCKLSSTFLYIDF